MIFPKSDGTFILRNREEVVTFAAWLNKDQKAKIFGRHG
jgi:hypothetical protein